MLRPPSFFQSPSSRLPQSDVTTDTISQSCPHIPAENYDVNMQSNNQIISQLQSEVRSLNKAFADYKPNNQIGGHLSNSEDEFALTASQQVSNFAEKHSTNANSIKYHELVSENSNLKSKVSQFEYTIQKLETDKRNLAQKIEFERCEKEKLKEAHIDFDSFQMQEENYLQKIAELQDKTQQTEKQCNFLNIRLESLQEIMKLHENKLTDDREESRTNIINLWREKVFTLLTQKKIAEFDIQKFEQDLETECQDFRNLNQELESEKALLLLTLNAKSAEVDSLYHTINLTETEIDNKTTSIEFLTGDNQRLKHTLNLTKSVIIDFNSRLNDFAIAKKSVLSNFQQRLLFLTKRVNFLVDYLSQRKFAVKSFEQSVQVSFPESAFFDGDEQILSIDGLTHGNLVNEVSFLMRERSILQCKLKEISKECENKIQTIQNDSSIEISNLSKEVSELLLKLENKEDMILRSKDEISQLSSFNSELNEHMTRLQNDFNKLKLQHENQLSKTSLEMEAKYSEKIRESENKLNQLTLDLQNSRNEVKHLQDNFSYERELAVTNLKLEKEALERKITDLKTHIQAIEAKKYMLSTNSQKTNPKFFAPKSSQTQPQDIVLMHTNCDKNLSSANTQTITDDNYIDLPPTPYMVSEGINECDKDLQVPVTDFYSILNEVTQLSNRVFSMP